MVDNLLQVADPRGGPEEAYLEALCSIETDAQERGVLRLLVRGGVVDIRHLLVYLDHVRGDNTSLIGSRRNYSRRTVRRIVKSCNQILKETLINE